jgi:spermidine synthase
MRAWVTHATSATPDGTPISLNQRGDEWIIRAGNADLMSSRMHGSEQEMARLARPDRRDATVLVGGLGMGFTLRAALDTVSDAGRVSVCELVPAVVDWNRGPLGPLAGNPLDDPRTTLIVGDVMTTLRATPGAWDTLLLDVDNGPDAFTQAGNAALYAAKGLERARIALRPGGAAAYWSAYEAPDFPNRLARAGFRPETHQVRAHGGKGARHVIYIGRV